MTVQGNIVLVVYAAISVAPAIVGACVGRTLPWGIFAFTCAPFSFYLLMKAGIGMAFGANSMELWAPFIALWMLSCFFAVLAVNHRRSTMQGLATWLREQSSTCRTCRMWNLYSITTNQAATIAFYLVIMGSKMDRETVAAYSSIVAAMSEHARSKASHDDAFCRKYFPNLPQTEIVYSHDYMSTFEAVVDTLHRLGIMTPLDGMCYSITSEPQQDYELAQANWPNGPSFEELLAEFVDLFGEFGTAYWGFGTSAEIPFKPTSQRLTMAMNALTAIGYAEHAGDSYLWTGKVEAAMVAGGFWPENAKARQVLYGPRRQAYMTFTDQAKSRAVAFLPY